LKEQGNVTVNVRVLCSVTFTYLATFSFQAPKTPTSVDCFAVDIVSQQRQTFSKQCTFRPSVRANVTSYSTNTGGSFLAGEAAEVSM
jgi:hypothetical protein